MEFIYLVIIIFWILAIVIFKENSSYALIPAFFLFLISAFFAVFNLGDIAEQIMRISFIGWIVGIVGVLIEYKKSNRF